MTYEERFKNAELTDKEICGLTGQDVLEYSHIQCQKILQQLPNPKETN